MKILRWILGALLGLYGLLSAVTVVGFASAYKLGAFKPPLDPALAKIEPWMAEVPWWSLALAALNVVLMLIAAWRLFTGGRAFPVALAALVLDVVHWWLNGESEGYKQAFTAEERAMDPVILGILAFVTLLIWFSERRKA